MAVPDATPGMDRERFLESARAGREPEGLSPPLRVLWLEASGDWEAAHLMAQDMANEVGARLHAYLHRREGDLSNAAYWYRRAREPMPDGALDDERAMLVERWLGST